MKKKNPVRLRNIRRVILCFYFGLFAGLVSIVRMSNGWCLVTNPCEPQPPDLLWFLLQSLIVTLILLTWAREKSKEEEQPS